MEYRLEYSKQAKKDSEKLTSAGLDGKAIELLKIIKHNPYKPPFEKLTRELKGCYSRKINKQHRIVYELLPNKNNLKDENGNLYSGIAHILRMWTHYGD